MKKNSILATLLAFPLALISCSQEKPAEEGSVTPSADYPLTTCVVSGEELGSMGEPYVHDHNGTTVKFCCKECLPKFNQDPEAYTAKLP